MSDKVEFTPELMAHLRGLAEKATARPWDSGADWVFFAGEYADPRDPLKAICCGVEQDDADYIAAAANHLPAALDEIERLRAELSEAREMLAEQEGMARAAEERIADLEAERDELRGDIADLWGACERLPHAADCDPDNTGYCTCYRGEFNSMLKNMQPEKGGEPDKSA